MCTLSCALIVCTLVSTARTTNTTTVYPNRPLFDSRETTTEEKFEDWLSTTPSVDGKYGSKPPLGTPSVTDPDEFVTDNATDSSTKLGNDYIPSDKNNSYTTEPIPTTNGTQLLTESPTRIASTARTTTADDPNVTKFDSIEDDTFEDWTSVQLPSTTFTAMQKDGSTTTPVTPSVTDLNVKPPQDVIGNTTSQPKPKNGYNLSQKKFSFTNDDTRSKPKRSKTKWSTDPNPFILFYTERPTRYYRTTEWIKPTNKNCKCVFGQQHSRRCKNNEEETPTTKIWGRFVEFKQWDQQRHTSETTTSNYEKQLEKSRKRELQQKVSEMESIRFNTILDAFKNR